MDLAMVIRPAAEPHPHHVDLVQGLAEDVRRNLARMGMMRGLTVVRLSASGAYRLSLASAEAVRPGFLADLGVGLMEAIEIIDDVLGYDPATEAAVLVVEWNPIDGALLTFMVQEIASSR